MKRTIPIAMVSALLIGAMSSYAAEPPVEFLQWWGTPSPQGIGTDSAGTVYVPDQVNRQVAVYDSNGLPGAFWGASGTAEGQFKAPRDAAVASDGSIYIADMFNRRVQKFDSAGNFVLMWGRGVATGSSSAEICFSNCLEGLWGNGPGMFDLLEGISVDTAGNVYVADTFNHRIQKFDSSGNYITHWSNGLSYPVRVAADAFGNVYVADTNNNRIQKFDSSGNFLLMWGWGVATGAAEFEICTASCLPGLGGAGTGQFNFPRGVGVDAQGKVYVAGNNNHRVQKFDSHGNFLLMWGWGVATGASQLENCTGPCLPAIGVGLGDGQFSHPNDVGTDAEGNVYVADNMNNRIQKFAPAVDRLTCLGFEPPMAAGPVTVKGNRALPFKAQLFDADGFEVTDWDVTAAPVVQVWYEYETPDADDVSDETLPAGQSTEGNQFFFDSDQMWHFNLKTKNYSAPGTYTVFMDTGDASEYVVDPTCVGEFIVE